eukprot:EG_transcript_54923
MASRSSVVTGRSPHSFATDGRVKVFKSNLQLFPRNASMSNLPRARMASEPINVPLSARTHPRPSALHVLPGTTTSHIVSPASVGSFRLQGQRDFVGMASKVQKVITYGNARVIPRRD